MFPCHAAQGGTSLCQRFQKVYEPTECLPAQTHRFAGPVPSHKPVWTLLCGWADGVQQVREEGSLQALLCGWAEAMRHWPDSSFLCWAFLPAPSLHKWSRAQLDLSFGYGSGKKLFPGFCLGQSWGLRCRRDSGLSSVSVVLKVSSDARVLGPSCELARYRGTGSAGSLRV